MTNYKRLTMTYGAGVYYLLCPDCPIGRHKCKMGDDCRFIATNRLGELEDKIESGELREVPFGAVILTPEEREEEMKAGREERAEFERRIELLNNELHRELVEHKAFIEKTAIEVGRLKAEKEQVVKEFAKKLQKELPQRDYTFNGNTYSMITTSSMKYVMDKLLKEYEKQLDEFADCKTCSAWSGSDCTRNPYTEGCLKEETK